MEEKKTEKSEKESKKEAKQEQKLSETLNKEIEKLKKDLEESKGDNQKLKSDIEQWKNSYYKAYADTENLRKSIEKDHQEAMKYRIEGFINNLLPVLDGFHIALNNEVKSEELKNYLVGFQYIYNNLSKILDDEGVKEINPKINDDYDEKIMEVVETKYEEGVKENKVLKVILKGYMLKDRLVRPAMVVVSSAKKNEEAPKENDDNQVKDA